MRALIVEDEEALQLLYERILSGLGCDVASVYDGFLAIKAIEDGFSPDLMILDIRMPNCNGLQGLEYLQSYDNVANMHLVIATASRDFESDTSMLPSCEFILKPVLSPNLLEIVGRVRV